MTRWARRNGAAGGKALDATPWEEMASGPRGREGRSGPLSLKKEQEKRKKKNKKKKDYLNEDVNGFAAYLRQSSEPGHGVADCPAVLESQDMGTGICYRCGSTEHDISKCKAKIDPAAGAFPYAKCFICGEMGHLSRSCPDNPKGLYAEDQVTVGRWATGMSADYEEITETPKLQKPKVKVPKVVTF
uniref:Zinc finger CCHC-type containing 9 n=1 Tax=Strix occidentalis caurina TaxID=311401 RepID=A0A8D0FLM2_STROC